MVSSSVTWGFLGVCFAQSSMAFLGSQMNRLKFKQEYMESLWSNQTSFSPAELATDYFSNCLDHFNGCKTKYQQRYYSNSQYYKAGGPVIVYVGGESELTSGSVAGGLQLQLAQRYGAMLYGLEHRYYGGSVPVSDFRTSNMVYLTANQGLQDLIVFKRAMSANLNRCTKWIAIGGSYPGALAAYARHVFPDDFFAAHSSSGPVEAKEDMFEYSLAVREAVGTMPYGSSTCVANWRRVVSYFDSQLAANPSATKSYFNLANIPNDGDAAAVVTTQFAWDVQYGGSTYLNAICGNSVFRSLSSTDAQLYTALRTWFVRFLPSYAYPINTLDWAKDTSAGWLRAWTWQTCDQFGYFQTAEHISQPMYSKFVDVNYYRWVCVQLFGTEHSIPKITAANAYFGGKAQTTSNIVYVNGNYDPWRKLSVTTADRPSTDGQPLLMHSGYHCGDLYGSSNVQSSILSNWDRIMAQSWCPSSGSTTTSITTTFTSKPHSTTTTASTATTKTTTSATNTGTPNCSGKADGTYLCQSTSAYGYCHTNKYYGYPQYGSPYAGQCSTGKTCTTSSLYPALPC